MLAIKSLNPELLSILTEFSDYFFQRDSEDLEAAIGDLSDKRKIKSLGPEAVGKKYIQDAIADANPLKYGFPRHQWGLELFHEKRFIKDPELISRCAVTNDKLMNFFGARNNALQMYYPAGGYIGWHNNCNASGYNIVLSCNPEARGYFEHYDHTAGKYNRFQDESGWNCKVGYFGSDKEPDKIYWHCAYTDSPRVTLSYVIYDENLWTDMVDDISAG